MCRVVDIGLIGVAGEGSVMYVTVLALHYLRGVVNVRFYVLLHSCYAIDKDCNIGQEGRQGMVP